MFDGQQVDGGAADLRRLRTLRLRGRRWRWGRGGAQDQLMLLDRRGLQMIDVDDGGARLRMRRRWRWRRGRGRAALEVERVVRLEQSLRAGREGRRDGCFELCREERRGSRGYRRGRGRRGRGVLRAVLRLVRGRGGQESPLAAIGRTLRLRLRFRGDREGRSGVVPLGGVLARSQWGGFGQRWLGRGRLGHGTGLRVAVLFFRRAKGGVGYGARTWRRRLRERRTQLA